MIFQKILHILFFCLMFFPSLSAETTKDYRCTEYAKESVEQNIQNKKYGCGFNTLRWNSDKSGQKKWCLTVNESISKKENDTRENMLDQCFQKYGTIDNKINQIVVPDGCQDSLNKFIPIYSIYVGHRYRDKLRTPVTEGLIRYDFNDDLTKDYLYIESDNEKNIKVVACISKRKKGYYSFTRKELNISFTYTWDNISDYRYGISISKGLVSAVLGYTAHNEGSSSSISTYEYDIKKEKFMLKNTETFESPVYYDYGNGLEPYPFSAPAPL